MSALALHDLIVNRVLVTRESARGLAPSIQAAIGEGRDTLTLDFKHVDGITPSFLDELLSIVQEEFGRRKASGFRLEIVNPPTALSSKFAAIGRSRGLVITEQRDGWVIERFESTSEPKA
jgi:hypothetical protein